MNPRLESWQSKEDSLWYWHLVGANGEIMARSSEGYETKEHADEGLDSARHAIGRIIEAEQAEDPPEDDTAPDPDAVGDGVSGQGEVSGDGSGETLPPAEDPDPKTSEPDPGY